MRKFCAVDCEGDVGNKGLLGVAFFSDECKVYTTDYDEIRELLHYHARKGYVFVAHNAEYDVHVISHALDYRKKVIRYNERLHHIVWYVAGEKKGAQVWDSVGLSARVPLAQLGKALGYPKYETPASITGEDIDHYRWKCDLHNTWECVECYALRDAEIVYRFMSHFQMLVEGWGCKLKPTLAGIATDVWVALDSPKDLSLRHRGTHNLARRSYVGARVECYKVGYMSQVYMADVTSMYPSVMANTPMPDPEHMVYMRGLTPQTLPIQYEGVSQVDISIPVMYSPPLPYTRRGIRSYPQGRITGAFTHLELRYALSLGARINAVYETAYSTHSYLAFSTTISTLWTLREEYLASGDPRSYLAKLLMNNIYGRLGVGEVTERETITDMPHGYDSRKDTRHKSFGEEDGHGLIAYSDEFRFGGVHTNVLWASYITAAARIKLHQLMTLQGTSLVYSDTDSIISLSPIQGLSEGLGGLKDEGHYEAAIVCFPKLYAVQARKEDMPDEWRTERCKPHDRTACDECRWYPKAKGVARSVALRFIRGESVTFQAPVTAKTAIRTGKEAGSWTEISRTPKTFDYRREPIHPEKLQHGIGWSDTLTPTRGPLP